MRNAIAVGLAVLSMALLSAQEPSFEVASVKVNAKGETDQNAFQTIRPGQVSIQAMPLRMFLPTAFGVPFDADADSELSCLPSRNVSCPES